MKLAVLQNPPYHINNDKGDGTIHASPLYHKFITTILDELSPNYLVSLNPSRWMAGGRGLDKFRQRMMRDKSIKVIVDDMSPSGIFPSVDIAGGVNYFLWDKSHDGKCLFNGVERLLDVEDIVIRENESISILRKVKLVSKKWLGTGVSPRKPYGLAGNVKPTEDGVPCWFKNSIGLSFVDPTTVKDTRHDVHKWRVLVPRAMPGNIPLLVDGGFFNEKRIIIAKPGEYCTETFVVVRTFTCKSEAENFLTYLNTRFFRFMLRMRTVSQDVTRENYNWVPDLDYSCPWTDAELYDMFGLNRQEQRYIESKIKGLR